MGTQYLAMKRWMSLSLSTIIIIIWSNSKIPMRIVLTIIISRWRSSWRVCMFPRTQLQRSLQGRSWRRHFRKWRSALMRSRHIGLLWSQWSSWPGWSSPHQMLVATPQMRKRTALVYFSWLVVAMVYYGGTIIMIYWYIDICRCIFFYTDEKCITTDWLYSRLVLSNCIWQNAVYFRIVLQHQEHWGWHLRQVEGFIFSILILGLQVGKKNLHVFVLVCGGQTVSLGYNFLIPHFLEG